MTMKEDTVRAALRVFMTFTTAIPDYATDTVAQVRVGKVLALSAARVRLWPIEDTRY